MGRGYEWVDGGGLETWAIIVRWVARTLAELMVMIRTVSGLRNGQS